MASTTDDLAEKLASVEARVKLLEGQVKHQAASIDLLDSALRVARHGQQQGLEVNRRLLRAIRGAEVNLASAPLVLAAMLVQDSAMKNELEEVAQAIALALDLLAAAQREST